MNDFQFSDEIFSNQKVRMEIASQSHQWFFSIYFAHYLTSQSADLHRDLFSITEDESIPLAVIVAFRGSAKSTIMTMSFPIWAIIGVQQRKFVVIASQTQYQARIHLLNIKRELESNELLKNDLGPFVVQREEWGATSLYIPKYNARITAISTEQSIRGVRHGARRPDLIIADDVEDMNSVKTRDGRNKTFNWFTGEIIPAGDTDTKIIAIGNLLHEDSLLMRLKELIDNGETDGTYRQYPIVDKNGKSLWPGKYPDEASLKHKCRSIGNKVAWQREYMLLIVSDEDQVIDSEWIKHYDDLPAKTGHSAYVGSFISVDLAISQSAVADYTAIIIIHIFGVNLENRRYYIDRLFINKRMSHLKTLDAIAQIYKALIGESCLPMVLVEDVAYQSAVIEQLKDKGIYAEGVKICSDKRSRLQIASLLFEQGKVLFSKDRRSKAIIQQLVSFGVEKHDDLADAVSMGLNYIQINVNKQQPTSVVTQTIIGARRRPGIDPWSIF